MGDKAQRGEYGMYYESTFRDWSRVWYRQNGRALRTALWHGFGYCLFMVVTTVVAVVVVDWYFDLPEVKYVETPDGWQVVEVLVYDEDGNRIPVSNPQKWWEENRDRIYRHTPVSPWYRATG